MQKRYVILPVAILAWILIQFCYDVSHPELWSDWRHDPKMYGIVLILIILIVFVAFALDVWSHFFAGTRKLVDPRLLLAKRRMSMFDVVLGLFRSGRRQEATEALLSYCRITLAITEAEEVKLTKQFMEKYEISR